MLIAPLIALLLGQAAGTPQEKKEEGPADKSGTSFYPMPAFSSDKNSGFTWGLLGALMFTNENGIQDRLITAMVAHQHLAGWSGELDYRYCPSPSGFMVADAYLAARTENAIQLSFEESHWMELNHARLEFLELRRGDDRFFGRG